jgi:hypothetical protein
MGGNGQARERQAEVVTPADRRRLARILGMLGSEHAGERASAALQAEAFRKRHGMTWAELLNMAPVEDEPPFDWDDDFEDEQEPEPPPPVRVRHKPTWPIHDRTVMGFGAVWLACVVFICVWQNI